MPVLRERIGNDDVGIVLGAVTVVDEDGDRARALARREVAMYFDIVAPYDPTLSSTRSCSRASVPSSPRAKTSGRRAPLDDLLERFAFAGTPAEVAAQAAALFDAGALRVDFGTPHGLEEKPRHRAPVSRGPAAS